MPLANILSEITDWITELIGDHGLYAVFTLMAIDAVLPAASEVVMVYAGAVAAGAFAGQSVELFGYTFDSGFPAYIAMALAGTIGYVVGSIGGWALGKKVERPWLDKHGRWLHLDAKKLDRAEQWFDRWGDEAVFIGRITPVVRSFISVPAGIFEAPFARYVVLTTIGSALWCFSFAGIGWAAGESWEAFHDRFKIVDYAIAATIGLAAIGVAWHFWRRRRSATSGA